MLDFNEKVEQLIDEEVNTKRLYHCEKAYENNYIDDVIIDRHITNLTKTFGKEAIEKSFKRVTGIKTYKRRKAS